MTGVPRSSGCDACRKQKKKCDKLRPACSRCARLKLECVGAGTKRYKFVHIAKKHYIGESALTPETYQVLDPLVVVPMSPAARVSGMFFSQLEIHDVRYDISAFGDFFWKLPERTQLNKALETAMDAFSVAFSHNSGRDASFTWLKKYNTAIRTLRDYLQDPLKAETAETLCAIYLLVLAQARCVPDKDQWVSHEEGLSHILELLVQRGHLTEFEEEVLAVVSVPLIYGSVINPKVTLSPRARSIIEAYYEPRYNRKLLPGYEGPEFEGPVSLTSVCFNQVAEIPAMINEPELHVEDIYAAYFRARVAVPMLGEQLASLTLERCPRYTPRERARRDCQAAFVTSASFLAGLTQMIQIMDPYDDTLQPEAEEYVDQVIRTAEEALIYRPMGSSSMTGSLGLCSACTRRPEAQRRIEELLYEYRDAFRGEDCMLLIKWWHYKFMQIRIRLGSPLPTDDLEKAEYELSKKISWVQCTASHNYKHVMRNSDTLEM